MLPASDTHWLNIQYRTLFRLDSAGRIVGENDPDRSAGAAGRTARRAGGARAAFTAAGGPGTAQ